MSRISDKLISVERASELQQNWISHQGAAIEKQMGIRDSGDFLFDLEELQEYIDLVRKESADQGIEKPGIRIFFGAYSEEKVKNATIFMAPTKNVQYSSAGEDGESGEVETNYSIKPLNTVTGGIPPTIY